MPEYTVATRPESQHLFTESVDSPVDKLLEYQTSH